MAQTDTLTGSGSPYTGTFTAKVTADHTITLGAAGAAGGSNNVDDGLTPGGGGGGGARGDKVVALVNGQIVSWQRGKGGTTINSRRTFWGDATTIMVVSGASGGSSISDGTPGAGGAGGASGSCVGCDHAYTGGAGAAGTATIPGGGGGGGGSSAATAGTGNAGAVGGAHLGGAGGATTNGASAGGAGGNDTTGVAVAGSAWGGGGGGRGGGGAESTPGGIGGDGLLTVTYSSAAPTLSSPAISADGTTLTASFSLTATYLPASGSAGFTVTVGGVPQTPTWTASSTGMSFALTSAVKMGQTVTYAYDGTQAIKYSNSDELASFGATSVTNSSTLVARRASGAALLPMGVL